MKFSEYVVGGIEALGILVLACIPNLTCLPILLILAGKYLYSDALWVIPSSLFTVQTVNL